jgi:hypothetical protein
MKRLIEKETLLTYPNFKKQFEIHADVSKVQLNAYKSQVGRTCCLLQPKTKSGTDPLYYSTEQE